jgi:Sulfotransferase family
VAPVTADPGDRLLLWVTPGATTAPLLKALATLHPDTLGFHASLTESGGAPLQEHLRSALPDDRGVLIHLVDERAPTLHLSIAQAAAGIGFRHLLLCERNPFVRLLNAWHHGGDPSAIAMKRIVRHAAAADAHLNQVLQALRLMQQPRRMVSVEALAGGPADGSGALQAWADLLRFLGLAPIDAQRLQALQAAFTQAVADPALSSSASALDAAALRRELVWLPGPWITRSNLQTLVHAAEPATASVHRFQLRSPPMLTEPGSVWPIEGSLEVSGSENSNSAVALTVDQDPATAGSQGAGEEPKSTHLRSERASATSAVVEFRGLGRRTNAGDRWRFAYRPSQSAGEPVATVRFVHHPRAPIPGIFLAPWSIGYQPIPKAACTSLKAGLLALANGAPPAAHAMDGAKHVHQYFAARTTDVSGADFKFIVIRDPVARFVSGYSNRVGQHRELSETYLRGLPSALQLPLQDFVFDPTLSQFIEHFDLYMRVPTIRHHFLPVADQVLSLEAFDKVYPLEAMDTLCADLSRWTGRPFVVPREQRSRSKRDANELSDAQRQAIVKLCERDYDMLQAYYTPAGRAQGAGA